MSETNGNGEVKRGSNGLFLPGTKAGPGRKPGRPDLYLLAERLAAKEGYDLEQALWDLLKKMIELGRTKGDVAATKLALDHLGLPARQLLELAGLPEQVELTPEEIDRRVSSLLARAMARANLKMPLTNGSNGAPAANGSPAPDA